MKKGIAVLLLALFSGVFAIILSRNNISSPSNSQPVKIGYTSTPLAAPLFAVEFISSRSNSPFPLQILPFSTSGDIGYAIISGDLDAGFVEVNKAKKLLSSPQGKKLHAIGSLQFPYGATLVIRKDLQLRLGDVKGLRVAARNSSCDLLKQFEVDAQKYHLDWNSLKFTYIDFDSMIPALESGTVDAAILKGSYALLAQKLGHKILYQNWNVVSSDSDECCPPSISQIDYLLVVKKTNPEIEKNLSSLFEKASELPLSQVREITATKIAYPVDILSEFPISVFKPLTKEELGHLLETEQCNTKENHRS